METKLTHKRAEVIRFYSISFPFFELLHTLVTFPYKLPYLRRYAMSYNNVHGCQGAWDTCVLTRWGFAEIFLFTSSDSKNQLTFHWNF